MSRLRVHNLCVSLDGYAAGTHVTLEKPIGDARALFSLVRHGSIHGIGGSDDPVGLDDVLTSTWAQNIGAEIMGRRKFGPQAGPWKPDDDWRGWWGEEPPFLTPVVVLTHHPREPLEFENGTVFHFVDADAPTALGMARELAGGLDVRRGGGPSTVRQFLEADLVDFLHIAVVPVTVGQGGSLLGGIEHVRELFDIETVPSASGVEHQLWNRRARESSASTPR
ncbi:dihydrofolate reductase family protein [Nocardioides acrostichi]|uniref:Dihydrofolate reductase family protein n=1 Tax=Nocardioides acrostichi TaxID=2784339 RepID=A0A930UYB5_9ACTN|nr:dihydrofolate reductase family protein [Nocardioides acrostichi]MBF4160245.1 dihydrofolate reductase family protein [Nocardioides acrostichi]